MIKLGSNLTNGGSWGFGWNALEPGPGTRSWNPAFVWLFGTPVAGPSVLPFRSRPG